MMRAFYSLLMWLAQPLLRRKLQRRGQLEPGYLQHIEERFGRYAAEQAADGTGYLWVHAVSLGETRAAAALIRRLRERLPGMRLLLTHSTATGRAEGLGLLRSGDRQVWLPWDTPAAVRRFLDRFKPRLGVLMETEIWPNLSVACARRGIPLVLVNARLSEKSLRQARRLAWLARPAYRALTAVWAQTVADASRLASLGAPVKATLGNLKFDAGLNVDKLAQGRAWRAARSRPVLSNHASTASIRLNQIPVMAMTGEVSRPRLVSNSLSALTDSVQVWPAITRYSLALNFKPASVCGSAL